MAVKAETVIGELEDFVNVQEVYDEFGHLLRNLHMQGRYWKSDRNCGTHISSVDPSVTRTYSAFIPSVWKSTSTRSSTSNLKHGNHPHLLPGPSSRIASPDMEVYISATTLYNNPLSKQVTYRSSSQLPVSSNCSGSHCYLVTIRNNLWWLLCRLSVRLYRL